MLDGNGIPPPSMNKGMASYMMVQVDYVATVYWNLGYKVFNLLSGCCEVPQTQSSSLTKHWPSDGSTHFIPNKLKIPFQLPAWGPISSQGWNPKAVFNHKDRCLPHVISKAYVREVMVPTGRTAGLYTNLTFKEVSRKLQMKWGLSLHSQWAQSNSPWRPEHRYWGMADLVWSGLWPPCEVIHKSLSAFKASLFDLYSVC